MTVPQLCRLHYKTVTSGFGLAGLAGVVPGPCLGDLFQTRSRWCRLTEWPCWEPGSLNRKSNNQTRRWISGKVCLPSQLGGRALWPSGDSELAVTAQVSVGSRSWCSCTRKQKCYFYTRFQLMHILADAKRVVLVWKSSTWISRSSDTRDLFIFIYLFSIVIQKLAEFLQTHWKDKCFVSKGVLFGTAEKITF